MVNGPQNGISQILLIQLKNVRQEVMLSWHQKYSSSGMEALRYAEKPSGLKGKIIQ
jgi:hypothetical protein